MRRLLHSATVLTALAAPLAALAAEPAGGLVPPPPAGWVVTLGVEGRLQPEFRGADTYMLTPYPVVDIRRVGTPEKFRAPRDGISWALLDMGQFRAGPVGKFRRGRDESDDPALRGLGDVDWAGEVGGFAEHWWAPWLRVRAEVRQGFGGHHGVVADFTMDAVIPVTNQLTLAGGPRLTWASNAANAPYFSINQVQALASGLPIYDAKGGLQAVGAGAQVRYRWSPEWAAYVYLEYERLTAGAGNSPLVTERGSPDQATVGVGLTRSFTLGPLW